MSNESPYALTAEDLRALRTATGVIFQYHGKESKIRAVLDRHAFDGAPVIFTAAEQRTFLNADRVAGGREREIPATVAMMGYEYGGERGWRLAENPDASAFHYIQTAQYSNTWQTIARLLRAGDAIHIVWTADNNNGYVTDAGLHVDRVEIAVARAKQNLYFHIGTSVTAANSARMIKRQGV